MPAAIVVAVSVLEDMLMLELIDAVDAAAAVDDEAVAGQVAV